MKPVLILMSTFNGSAFIDALLSSLRAQSHKAWCLWVRDDGSTDGTLDMMQRYASQDARIHILQEPEVMRRGACASFSELLARFAQDADYLMFCDQDDVWLPNKIEVTLDRMREMERGYPSDIPLLVHTDLSVTDCRLNVVAHSFWRYQGLSPKVTTLRRLLVQNNVTGCTVMVNRQLAKLASPVPSQAIMHDWWLALAAAAFGEIGFVAQPTLLYRQHGANDTGAVNYGLAYALKAAHAGLGDLNASLWKTQGQACAFLKRYALRLSFEQQLAVSHYCQLSQKNFWERRWIMFRHGFFKQGFLRNAGLFLAL